MTENTPQETGWDGEALLKTAQVAKLLNMHPDDVARLAKKGVLASVKIRVHSLRFVQSEIRRFIEHRLTVRFKPTHVQGEQHGGS